LHPDVLFRLMDRFGELMPDLPAGAKLGEQSAAEPSNLEEVLRRPGVNVLPLSKVLEEGADGKGLVGALANFLRKRVNEKVTERMKPGTEDFAIVDGGEDMIAVMLRTMDNAIAGDGQDATFVMDDDDLGEIVRRLSEEPAKLPDPALFTRGVSDPFGGVLRYRNRPVVSVENPNLVEASNAGVKMMRLSKSAVQLQVNR
jgi:hypothetical protein